MTNFKDRFEPIEIERAKLDVQDWLDGNDEGFPRSWAEEEKREARSPGFWDLVFAAPSIAGYEALEVEGSVVRIGARFGDGGEERVHFKRVQVLST
jgi:hypothetical protein